MKEDQEKIIKKAIKTVIPYIDELPYGKVIPSSWRAPEGFENLRVKVNGIPVEHLVPDEKKTDRIIIQFHGGGYLVGLCNPYRKAAVKYSSVAGGAEVYSIDYRVAPTNKYPSALEDAVYIYKWLLKRGRNHNKMIIVGDSAGGNLALATTLYLKDNDIPLPKAVIAISPWANASNDFPSVQLNLDNDVILGRRGLKMADQMDDPLYFHNANLEDPYVSPVFGNYKGFPSLLIQLGEKEVLLDDGLKVSEVATKAGVNSKVSIYKEMSHDFQIFIPELEESKNAWEEIEKFIEDNV
ncbi:MAG: alpha/beta hydrolase [Clostridium sp.]|nr:alpha/beta hydrolase [Clostridium sp.]